MPGARVGQFWKLKMKGKRFCESGLFAVGVFRADT